jgi:hypothetical protein
MMRYRAVIAGLFVWSAAAVATPAESQSYRVRVDARAQSAAFRGLIADSIAAALAVPSASGGLETPDGHALRCGAGEYCFYWRPGGVLRGVPVSTSASLILWGLGTEGLSFRANGRLVADLGRDHLWPATSPSVQLNEGYFEYVRSRVSARAGRQLVASRLEAIGFDGAWLKVRLDTAQLELTGYGGWGLGQAAALTAPSPSLNPLDEWRPRNRQIVMGAEAAWFYRGIDLRGEYRREIDPEDNYFVSERTAFSFATPSAVLRAAGGLDYNIAEGQLGSADVTLMYTRPRYSLTGGVRRYRPYFSLWTLWGAFSPVPYNAVNISAQFRPTGRLSLRARGESYRYEDAHVSTGLVPQLETGGWRASAGATANLSASWAVQGDFSIERGPGASGRFADGSVSWTPDKDYSFELYGGTMARPLELRYYDATSRWIGGRAEWQLNTQRRVWADVALVDDERDRPDASASSLTQLRLRAGVSFAFGSGADRTPLPPARPLSR